MTRAFDNDQSEAQALGGPTAQARLSGTFQRFGWTSFLSRKMRIASTNGIGGGGGGGRQRNSHTAGGVQAQRVPARAVSTRDVTGLRPASTSAGQRLPRLQNFLQNTSAIPLSAARAFLSSLPFGVSGASASIALAPASAATNLPTYSHRPSGGVGAQAALAMRSSRTSSAGLAPSLSLSSSLKPPLPLSVPLLGRATSAMARTSTGDTQDTEIDWAGSTTSINTVIGFGISGASPTAAAAAAAAAGNPHGHRTSSPLRGTTRQQPRQKQSSVSQSGGQLGMTYVSRGGVAAEAEPAYVRVGGSNALAMTRAASMGTAVLRSSSVGSSVGGAAGGTGSHLVHTLSASSSSQRFSPGGNTTRSPLSHVSLATVLAPMREDTSQPLQTISLPPSPALSRGVAEPGSAQDALLVLGGDDPAAGVGGGGEAAGVAGGDRQGIGAGAGAGERGSASSSAPRTLGKDALVNADGSFRSRAQRGSDPALDGPGCTGEVQESWRSANDSRSSGTQPNGSTPASKWESQAQQAPSPDHLPPPPSGAAVVTAVAVEQFPSLSLDSNHLGSNRPDPVPPGVGASGSFASAPVGGGLSDSVEPFTGVQPAGEQEVPPSLLQPRGFDQVDAQYLAPQERFRLAQPQALHFHTLGGGALSGDSVVDLPSPTRMQGPGSNCSNNNAQGEEPFMGTSFLPCRAAGAGHPTVTGTGPVGNSGVQQATSLPSSAMAEAAASVLRHLTDGDTERDPCAPSAAAGRSHKRDRTLTLEAEAMPSFSSGFHGSQGSQTPSVSAADATACSASGNSFEYNGHSSDASLPRRGREPTHASTAHPANTQTRSRPSSIFHRMMMQRSFQQNANAASTPFARAPAAAASAFSNSSAYPGPPGFRTTRSPQESGCMDIVTDGAGEEIAALPHLQLPLSPGSSTGFSLDTPQPYDSGPGTSTGVWEDATSALGNIGSTLARQLQQQQRRLLYGDRAATVSTELEESGSLPPSPMPQGMRAYHAAGGGSGNSRREAHRGRGGCARGVHAGGAGSKRWNQPAGDDELGSGLQRWRPQRSRR
ncbi:MAG: hypothetical protein WDW36_001206 [Sanguina aurantia]